MAFENTLASLFSKEKEANGNLITEEKLELILKTLIADIQSESGTTTTDLQAQIDDLDTRVTALEP